jgi:hypothetical protein
METVYSTLVMVESGAATLGLGPHARMVVQHDDEMPSAFASRARSYIEGDSLQRVVLLAGATNDFPRVAARAQLAQAAAAHLASAGGGSLVLAASDPRGELAQRALGEILRGQLDETVSVSVRDVDTFVVPMIAPAAAPLAMPSAA